MHGSLQQEGRGRGGGYTINCRGRHIKGNESGEGTDENYLRVVSHSFLVQASLMTQCTFMAV